MLRSIILIAFGVSIVGGPSISEAAPVAEYINFSEWSSNAGLVTSITFTEYPIGTLITDQYSDLGATFPDANDHVLVTGGSVVDSHWLDGGFSDSITVQFDRPRIAVGAHFPGRLFFELYSGEQLIYTSSEFPVFSVLDTFAGLVSTTPFDRVVLRNPSIVFPTATIDNLYFGPPIPAPGALGVLVAGLLMHRRRRR